MSSCTRPRARSGQRHRRRDGRGRARPTPAAEHPPRVRRRTRRRDATRRSRIARRRSSTSAAASGESVGGRTVGVANAFARTLLGPSEHLARAAIVERQPQAETSQPFGVRRRTDPEFGRTERLLMIGQDAQPCRGSTLRPAPLSFGGTQVGRRQPCGGTAIGHDRGRGLGRRSAAGRGRTACRRAAGRSVPRTRGRPTIQTAIRDVRDRARSDRPARPVSSFHDDSVDSAATSATNSEIATHPERPAARNSSLAVTRLAVGSFRVVLGEAGPSQEQTRFGEVHHVADLFEGADREFGVLAGFGMQPGGNHQLTPIRRQHPRAPAGIADLGVQRVGAGERRQAPWRCRPATRR